jgi:5-methylcytosine-specific restriction protein A
MVCGPAAAGKSTHVEQHAGPKDVVIDLDVIRAELAGTAIHQPNEGYIAAALDERNARLRALATDTEHERAWFIVSAPGRGDRELWQRKLNADVIMLDTPLDECERRIRADERRRGQEERMVALAADWWKRYRDTPG